MKVRLAMLGGAAAALAIAGGSASAKSPAGSGPAATAASACTASLAIEGPFTGPVAQLGLEQLHFAQLAVAQENKAYGMHVSLAQDDTQLTPSIATTKTQSIIASNAVATIGPAGSQEVEAVGPLFGRAGMAFISGSATATTLASSANPTFFRAVPDDSVQGPQDANYIIKHLHPKAVLLVDDDEAYSQGLAKVMTPVLQKAGIKVNHQTYNGTDTGATLANALQSLVTSQLTSDETVTILPWQTAANAQMFGQDVQQQGKKTILFGTDGTDSPTQFKTPGQLCVELRSGHPARQGRARKVDREGCDEVRSVRRLRRPDLCGYRGRDAGDSFGLRQGADAVSQQRPRCCPQDEHRPEQEPARSQDRVHVARQPGRQPLLSVQDQRRREIRLDS